MGKVLGEGILMPRRAAENLALPDGAPSKVASRASERWLAVFGRIHNKRGHRCLLRDHSGSSGSRRALRRADVADADAVERTKLQRIEAAC
jgi:hypothetical protein